MPDWPGILAEDVGLLLHGCRIDKGGTREASGTWVQVTWPTPVTANGWWFEVAGEEAQEGGVARFTARYKREGDAAWRCLERGREAEECESAVEDVRMEVEGGEGSGGEKRVANVNFWATWEHYVLCVLVPGVECPYGVGFMALRRCYALPGTDSAGHGTLLRH